MPWFIWMCFLTVPVMVGVGCTLASDKPYDPKGFPTVVLVGGVWLFLAYHLKNWLRSHRRDCWAGRWFMLAVVLPIVTLFMVSLNHSPEIKKLVQARIAASEKSDRQTIAAAAPTRRALTWAETRQLLAHMQPLALVFAIKLFTAMPAAWWFLAFGIGLWKGKS
jgi:hypothetical protein